MKKRKHLSKKLRFEIFKRDDFTCQYCGKHPPECVLEVDHIIPVKEGGDNSEENLITACFDCNRGKSANSLNIKPQSIADKSKETAEREEQIRGYNKIFAAKKERLENEAWEVIKELCLYDEKNDCTQKEYFTSAKRFVDKLGLYNVLDAAEIACKNGSPYNDNSRFRYFCGVCWNKIRKGGCDNE